MSIKFIKEEELKNLYNCIAENIECYKSKGFTDIFEDMSMIHLHDGLTFDTNKIQSISGSHLLDASNSSIIFKAMPGMTPYLAKDERIWVYLCHTVLFDYINERWPVPDNAPDEKIIQHIKLHFFAKTDRNFERDNAGSRLWWGAYFASQIKNMDFDDAVSSICRNQDYRSVITGRPTSSSSMNLFGILLENYNKSLNGDKKLTKRENYQKYLKEVNLMGGRSLIPVMTDSEIKKELEKFEDKIIGVNESFTTESPLDPELDEKLHSELTKFDKDVILEKYTNMPDENRILNDENLTKFVACKPTDISEFLDSESFDLASREKLAPQGEFLKDILAIIDKFVEENYY